MELSNLFSSRKIGTVKIKNRLVRSATAENMAIKAHPTDLLRKLYSDLAEGGIGLIITGGIAVDPSSTLTKNGTGLYEEALIPSHRKVVKAVHDISDVKIAAQIVHAGRQSGHKRYEMVAPSPIPSIRGRIPRELTTEQIRNDIVTFFVECGLRAYDSGYDMVQLHAAHGYLLSGFLSPFTNKRTDEYGGSIENRVRILVEIYDQLRDEVGQSFPIIIKLQTQDGDLAGGLSIEEGMQIAKIIVDTGFDAIEPSGGGGDIMMSDWTLPSVHFKSPDDENYFLSTVKEIKGFAEKCPIILMGGIRNPTSAENFLRENHADFISMSRPLIYEPDLPERWMNGDHATAKCINCNKCYRAIIDGPLECPIKKKREQQARY
ncbi:MAG: NADH:flavin oxidoreductase [Candidatus Hodarchaeota archaeon]